ncbi:MAG TPA: fimbria/pilus periplasmic chaperone [Anaeromyxobacter sp.]|nr:fimbria/pilus periplasmic chaperone [Anaeromyxobacter sp.]
MALRRLLVAAVAVGLGTAPAPGRVLAQALQITPIQLELTPKAKNAVVTVQNLGTEPMRLQVSAFGWDQGPRGDMKLSRTKDVTFFPGLLTVGPGQRRNVRVAAATSFGDVEKTYRLFVEQLPGGPGAAGASVRVLTRVGIPVYLEPPRPARGAELSPVTVEGRKISFVLRNSGNVRIRPELVKVVGRDQGGQDVFEQQLSAWYVLAGGERVFETEAPRDGCARVRSVTAEVQVEAAAIEPRVAPADGACGP